MKNEMRRLLRYKCVEAGFLAAGLCVFAVFMVNVHSSAAQKQQPVWSEQEKPIVQQLRGLRQLPDERRARIAAALEFVALEETAHRQVRGYSGGMMRRLEIALAMLHLPRLLFLDEPTSGLDPLARQAVWQHLRSLAQEYRMTVFLTTHFMEEADHLCGRVAIMNLGRVVALGRPEELKASIGRPEATLDEVFAHYTGHELDDGGNYREISRTRRTLARLG
jgi:ABC-2 type transport system ATP-binding protein